MKKVKKALQEQNHLRTGPEEKNSPVRYIPDQQSRWIVSEYALAIIGKKKFKLHQKFIRTLDQLRLYFNNDPKSKLDPDKGILLLGPTGTGKTEMMRIMSRHTRHTNKRRFDIQECIEIMDLTKNKHAITLWADPKEWAAKCFDDLGLEQVVNSYGTHMDSMESILTLRHSRKLMTHATTNLSESALLDRYGERANSRFKEMFNFVVCDWQDFREINQ